MLSVRWLILLFFLTVAFIVLVVYLRRSKKREQRLSNLRLKAEVDADRSSVLNPQKVKRRSRSPYYLVVDTETNKAVGEEGGADAADVDGLELLQVAFALLDEQARCYAEYSYVLQIKGEVMPEATAIHGLTQADARKGFAPHRVLDRLNNLVARCDTLVAHNLPFHKSVLIKAMEVEGLDTTELASHKSLCTMAWGQQRLALTKHPSLSNLFGTLYYERPDLKVVYKNKSLRDVRLVGAILRKDVSNEVMRRKNNKQQ